MNVWVLVIIFGISSWGAAGRQSVAYPDKESCYEALEKIKITGQKQVSGDDDEQSIVFCMPRNIQE